jgi:uncharacterized protein YyaL (SSP411 family)
MAESGERTGSYNHLIHEKSPYLLQHAKNPVDWYPWREEAFQKARQEDKPIFLSIGYATCHWCHVMAHESFEDPEVAHLLNQFFVSIKVDREERPDIDQIYMSVCQALTGQGGWPLSIFMTPEGSPFFAGTYFPKSSRMGMAGFTDLLKRIENLWRTDRERILQGSGEIRRAIQGEDRRRASGSALDLGILKKGFQQFVRSFDETWGGFGVAPKFPTPHHLTFLLYLHSLGLHLLQIACDRRPRDIAIQPPPVGAQPRAGWWIEEATFEVAGRLRAQQRSRRNERQGY